MALLRFMELLEKELGKEATKDFQPMQPGDVVPTAADASHLGFGKLGGFFSQIRLSRLA